MKSFKVKSVVPGSVAEEAGIEPGDRLISINGELMQDVFDYRFLETEEELTIEIEKGNGEIWEVEIEKDEYEDIGMEFEDPMMDDARCCTNKCIFCFIDQLPKGMRETLYFKDDDTRLSFLSGNYVTLTNMKERDIERIIRYRMSPINISVHTTNPDLRVFMLKNRFAGDIMDKIKTLVKNNINVNCQIVLCRGINDGDELDRTISDLGELYPGVKSISVVPVGITDHREGLVRLEAFDVQSSAETIKRVQKFQKYFKKKFNSNLVYLADEFYINAEIDIPDYSHYEDFPQLENGVGLIALLRHEFYQELEKPGYILNKPRKISIATGVSPVKYIKEMVAALSRIYNNLNVNVYDIKNNFFGKHVTVTGLLTGKDIIEQLGNADLGEELLISKSMLKSDEDVLLDDYRVEDIEKALGVKVVTVENNGRDFINKILGVI